MSAELKKVVKGLEEFYQGTIPTGPAGNQTRYIWVQGVLDTQTGKLWQKGEILEEVREHQKRGSKIPWPLDVISRVFVDNSLTQKIVDANSRAFEDVAKRMIDLRTEVKGINEELVRAQEESLWTKLVRTVRGKR